MKKIFLEFFRKKATQTQKKGTRRRVSVTTATECPNGAFLWRRPLRRDNLCGMGVRFFLLLLGAATGCSSAPDPTADCCAVCEIGQACGDACISNTDTCTEGAGCACNADGSKPPPEPLCDNTCTGTTSGIIGETGTATGEITCNCCPDRRPVTNCLLFTATYECEGSCEA
jgi:hypothetical protein